MLPKPLQLLPILLLTTPTFGQATQQVTIETQPSVEVRLYQPITDIYLDEMPAQEAIELFSREAEIPIVANWEAIAAEGVDPQRPVSMDLQAVPAYVALELILLQMSPGGRAGDADLIYETTPWYVQIQTKAQANRQPVLRVVDVTDLLMTIPHFTDAPSLRLDEALQDDQGAVFEAEEDEQPELTKQERGENLAQTIRDTIEPTIWQANGGQYASIRYFNGRLIIRAPMYVQRQIQ